VVNQGPDHEFVQSSALPKKDNRLASVTGFAARFEGGSQPNPVSASQVNRWEMAASRPRFAVLGPVEESKLLRSDHDLR
jgi:hypothetical protein